MILDAATVVSLNALGGREILSVNLRTGSEKSARAIPWPAQAFVLVDAEGRLLGVTVTHALPEGARVGP